MTTPWIYRIDKNDAPPDRSQMSYGHQDNAPDNPEEFAKFVAGRARVEHPYYRGSLSVRVWPPRPDGEEHYRAPVPPDAMCWQFEAGTPEPPDPEPCEHGRVDLCVVCDGAEY